MDAAIREGQRCPLRVSPSWARASSWSAGSSPPCSCSERTQDTFLDGSRGGPDAV